MVRAVSAVFLAIFALPALADDGKPLKNGDPVPSNFRAFLIGDDRYEKGNPRNRIRKMHDLVADYGLNPVLAAFVPIAPGEDAPKDKMEQLEKLALEMSDLANEFKAQRLGCMILFLTLDAEYPAEDNTDKKAEKKAADTEAFWRQIDSKMPVIDEVKKEKRRIGVPFGLAPKAGDSAKAWGVTGDKIRVIYYDRMTVKQTWALDEAKPENLKAIRTFVDGELKPKR